MVNVTSFRQYRKVLFWIRTWIAWILIFSLSWDTPKCFKIIEGLLSVIIVLMLKINSINFRIAIINSTEQHFVSVFCINQHLQWWFAFESSKLPSSFSDIFSVFGGTPRWSPAIHLDFHYRAGTVLSTIRSSSSHCKLDPGIGVASWINACWRIFFFFHIFNNKFWKSVLCVAISMQDTFESWAMPVQACMCFFALKINKIPTECYFVGILF